MDAQTKVILIGGAPATGKTTLAKSLAKHFNYPYIKVDNLRWFLQHTVSKENYPSLFSFIKNKDLNHLSNEEIIEKYWKIAKILEPGVKSIIDIYTSKGLILEGIDIVPELYSEIIHNVSGILLHEDENNLIKNKLQRKRGNRGANYYKNAARLAVEHGNKLIESAKVTNFYLIKSSPIDTLLSRTLAVLDE